jgi:hypothetical protein
MSAIPFRCDPAKFQTLSLQEKLEACDTYAKQLTAWRSTSERRATKLRESAESLNEALDSGELDHMLVD